MRTMLSLVTLAALAGPVLAGGGGLAGRVTDAVTGAPLAGVVVTARSEGGRASQARTNERGAYLFDELRPGDYRVRAAGARGYEPAVYPRRVTVRAGEVTRGIDFALFRVANPDPGAISGQVTDENGRPLAHALVMAHGRYGRRAARADAGGEYVIRGLRPGTYRVVAAARGYLRAAYPEPVDVRPGQTVEGINFALVPRRRTGGIAGRVTDARTGEPIARAAVVARGRADAARATTDRRGHYRMRLEPGDYRVRAMARGYESTEHQGPVTVRPQELTRDVDFALRRTTLSYD
ncbi:MAG: carboxypeptidase-like regulatory domain-containing protein [bacterium]